MRSDEELLQASITDEDAFAEFYRRHCTAVAGFFLHRTRDAELAADLTAETFAAALQGRRRYDPDKAPAFAWLWGIARHKLARAYDRGRVEDSARRKLHMAPLVLDDEALERVEATAGAEARAIALLDTLPADQAEAVRARVIDEEHYDDIARRVKASPAVIRQRVSRGLAALRTHVEEPTP
jgi:RNA polymerase sigma factor (sigma-70 family)